MANDNNIDGIISTTNSQILAAELKLPSDFNNSRTTGELAKLINYSTNTKTLYNKNSFNSVPDKQRPLMTWAIGETRNNFNNAFKDVVRISKYSISRSGLIFAGKQLLLQGLNAYNETKLYNPLMPVIGATHYATLGLVDRPLRFIEPNLGGALGALGLKTISSVFGTNAKPTAPKGTVGVSALPDNATDGGKGLLRGKTASEATQKFSSKWGPSPESGKFLSKVSNFLKSNTAVGTFLPIGQPEGTIYKVGDSSYGLMRLDDNNNLTYYTKDGIKKFIRDDDYKLMPYTPSSEIGGIDFNTYTDDVKEPINDTQTTGSTKLSSSYDSFFDNDANNKKLFNKSIKSGKINAENANVQYDQKYKVTSDSSSYYNDTFPEIKGDVLEQGNTLLTSSYDTFFNDTANYGKLFNKSIKPDKTFVETKTEKYEQKYKVTSDSSSYYIDSIPVLTGNDFTSGSTKLTSSYGSILNDTSPDKTKLFNIIGNTGFSYEEIGEIEKQKYSPGIEIGGLGNKYSEDNIVIQGGQLFSFSSSYYGEILTDAKNGLSPSSNLFNKIGNVGFSYEEINQQRLQKYSPGKEIGGDGLKYIKNSDLIKGGPLFLYSSSYYGKILNSVNNSSDPNSKLFNKIGKVGAGYEEIEDKSEPKYSAGSGIGGYEIGRYDDYINLLGTQFIYSSSYYGKILNSITNSLDPNSNLFNKTRKVGSSFEETTFKQRVKYSGGRNIGGKNQSYSSLIYSYKNNNLSEKFNDKSQLKDKQKQHITSTKANSTNLNAPIQTDSTIRDITVSLEKLISNPSLINKYDLNAETYVALNYANLMGIKDSTDVGKKAINYKSQKTYEAMVSNNPNALQNKNTLVKKGIDTNDPDNINLKEIINGDNFDISNYYSNNNDLDKYSPYSDDIIAFYFKDIVNDRYIPFRATVTGIQESMVADWTDVKYINRADRLYTYGGFSRTLSFRFNVAISSVKELLPTWKRINYFVGLVKPSNYTDGTVYSRFIIPPLIEFTIGDMYKNQPAVITQIGLSVPDNATWEVLPEEMAKLNDWQYLNGRINWRDSKNKYAQFPMECEINVNMNVLEKELTHTGGSHFGDFYIDNVYEATRGISGDESFSSNLYTRINKNIKIENGGIPSEPRVENGKTLSAPKSGNNVPSNIPQVNNAPRVNDAPQGNTNQVQQYIGSNFGTNQAGNLPIRPNPNLNQNINNPTVIPTPNRPSAPVLLESNERTNLLNDGELIVTEPPPGAVFDPRTGNLRAPLNTINDGGTNGPPPIPERFLETNERSNLINGGQIIPALPGTPRFVAPAETPATDSQGLVLPQWQSPTSR